MAGPVHVYPVAEESQHVLEGYRCSCSPRIEVNEDGVVVIHNRAS